MPRHADTPTTQMHNYSILGLIRARESFVRLGSTLRYGSDGDFGDVPKPWNNCQIYWQKSGNMTISRTKQKT